MEDISNDAYETYSCFNDKHIKEIATKFYFWWSNQPGTNTEAGFDEFMELQKRCVQCGARTPKEAEEKCICSGDNDFCHGQILWKDE